MGWGLDPSGLLGGRIGTQSMRFVPIDERVMIHVKISIISRPGWDGKKTVTLFLLRAAKLPQPLVPPLVAALEVNVLLTRLMLS